VKGKFSLPTQEERLATLEQSFGTLQKEKGKSIYEVKENTTIMLGLLQTLTQESKQTELRMEMIKIRMDQLETKFDAHTALLNEHTRVLSDHTRVLSDHTTRFDCLETRDAPYSNPCTPIGKTLKHRSSNRKWADNL